MGTSNVHLATEALVLLGDEPISSFTDGTAGATIAANLYETSYLSMLTNHRWRFATKQAKLSRLTAKPIQEWQYQFQLPSDCIYLIRTDAKDYQIYEDKVLCNQQELRVDYMFRVDESALPDYFSKAFSFFLANQFAVPLTGDTAKGQYYGQMYLTALKQAKFADSTQHPQDSFQDNPYVKVRW